MMTITRVRYELYSPIGKLKPYYRADIAGYLRLFLETWAVGEVLKEHHGHWDTAQTEGLTLGFY